MKLFYRKYGHGNPLIILHGLFGQSDNWNTLGRKFSEKFEVYLVDLRNHGLSPHSELFSYNAMSEDLKELLDDNEMQNASLIGHSMGGKVAMRFAMDHRERVSRMVVVDISPRKYEPQHDQVTEGLNAVDFERVKSRKEAEYVLEKYIPDTGTRQFLLKNLYWKEAGQLAWRFNLDAITGNLQEINSAMDEPASPVSVPSLFISGEHSAYIEEKDKKDILRLFPETNFSEIKNAGHWVHADQPELFFSEAIRFLTAGS